MRANPARGICLILMVTGLLTCSDEGQPQEDRDRPPGLPPGVLDPDEIPLKVQKRCPGAAGCADQGDGKLMAGFGMRDITPQVEPFEDKNGNGIWDAGEPFEDKNGNNKFDEYWIAGFGRGRLAWGVHDPVWVRALALRQNQTTVVVVSVDALGLFWEERGEVEKLLDKGLDIDLLLLHATHVHENADTVGGWGKDLTSWGINEYYQQQWRRGIAAAVTQAVRALRPVQVTFGSIAVEDPPDRSMKRYVGDARDPVIIDNVLHTMQFSEVGPQGKLTPVATLINWASHPESVGASNHLISSDFVHYLREQVEPRGGPVIYISGALGGQLGPNGIEPLDSRGMKITSKGFPMAKAIGEGVANFALTAMADPNARTYKTDQLKLAFRTTKFPLQIANRLYHFASMLRIYRRTVCCYDPNRDIDEGNLPSVETEVAYLTLGPAAIITNPGELLPELFIGGYDGKYAGTYLFIDMKQENAPDVGKAPRPPYLIDVMDGERPHRQTWGLTMDFVGYIVPRYNYVLHPTNPYFMEAKGDHYEETNSVGPLAEPQIVGTMRQLVLDGRPNTAR